MQEKAMMTSFKLAPALLLILGAAACSDATSGEMNQGAAPVSMNGQSLQVEGGEPSAVQLAGTRWTITSVSNKNTPGGAEFFLQFEDGKISGRAGCNTFGGTYSMNGNILTPSAINATRRACIGDMQYEEAALQILGSPLTVEQADGGKLVLRGKAGTISLTRAS
jgi:heat shock protein HslJ